MTAHCEPCGLNYDDDEHDRCPVCAAHMDEEEAYWRQLWNGERQAGLVGGRPDDPEPPADPRTPEFWGL